MRSLPGLDGLDYFPFSKFLRLANGEKLSYLPSILRLLSSGCLLAANRGDTIGAGYGQTAGAFYGEQGIPAE